MRRLCTICARGGSKGVPGKNMRMIAGKPLIAWTIEQAKASGLFDMIAVSSDDDEILVRARNSGLLAVTRPPELATDDAPKLPAIQHAAREAEGSGAWATEFDTFVDLDCTSPLRLLSDIAICVGMVEARGFRSVITASLSRHSPYFNVIEWREGSPQTVRTPNVTITTRQDAPKTFDCNASIYAWSRAALFSAKQILTPTTDLYVMPRERSIDIDDDLDFRIAEMLLKERVDALRE